MIRSLQRRLPPKLPRKRIGAAAISAARSRTCTTAPSEATAGAAAATACIVPIRMTNRPCLCPRAPTTDQAAGRDHEDDLDTADEPGQMIAGDIPPLGPDRGSRIGPVTHGLH